jgi:hypothetical protein
MYSARNGKFQLLIWHKVIARAALIKSMMFLAYRLDQSCPGIIYLISNGSERSFFMRQYFQDLSLGRDDNGIVGVDLKPVPTLV